MKEVAIELNFIVKVPSHTYLRPDLSTVSHCLGK